MNKYSSTFVRENNAAIWASTLPDSTFRQLVDGDCGGGELNMFLIICCWEVDRIHCPSRICSVVFVVPVHFQVV